jgi:mannose-6-phosphate isomerase
LRPDAGYADEARALRTALDVMRHPQGGWREAGAHPFQANAHMHLLEAAFAWEQVGAAEWAVVADAVAELALARFLAADRPVIREFFDARWRALAAGEGQRIEPGHQFEWAVLLDAWGARRGHAAAREAAKGLYATGLRGVDAGAAVAVNALAADLTIADAGTRLWAQTEYLKAALAFGDDAQALNAARGLSAYLQTPRRGAWRDKLTPDRRFVDEPAPATSLYHLTGALLPLMAAAGGDGGETP